MSLVLEINCKNALPIRAIPFVTGDRFPIDYVVRMLAGMDGFHRVSCPAHRLSDDGTTAEVLPKEWRRFIGMMEGLTAKLKAEDEAKGKEMANYSLWRTEALKDCARNSFRI